MRVHVCVREHTRVLSCFCFHWGAQSRKCSLNPRFTQIFHQRVKQGRTKGSVMNNAQTEAKTQALVSRADIDRVRAHAAPAESRRHNLQVPPRVRVLEEGRLCEQLQVREFGHQMTQCRKYRFLCSGGDDLRRSGRDLKESLLPSVCSESAHTCWFVFCCHYLSGVVAAVGNYINYRV